MKEKENETTSRHVNPLCQIYRSAFQMDHGIRQIESTTGSGKSYVLGEEILMDLKDQEHHRFVITTTRLNNLSSYEDHFRKAGIGDQIYFARGNADKASDLLRKQKANRNLIPGDVLKFKSWNDMVRAESRGADGAEDLSRAYSSFANDVKQFYGFCSKKTGNDTKRSDYDVSLYRAWFYDHDSGRNIFLTDPKKYSWLKIAFPDIDGMEKDVIMLSVRKLDASIVLPFDVPFSKNWTDYLCLPDRNMVFCFDESDSDKIEQKRSIIEEAYKGERLELFSITRDMIEHIRSSLTGPEGSLIREQMKIQGPEKYASYFARILAECDDYDKAYHSAYPYRSDDSLLEQNFFFYNTGDTIGMIGKNISRGKEMELTVEFDGMVNRIVQKKRGESKATLEDLIQRSLRIASLFRKLICIPLMKHRISTLEPKDGNALYIDHQFYFDSVMGDFGFFPAASEFIQGPGSGFHNIMQRSASSSGNFYEDGLLYISLTAPPESMVRMNATMINTTPESRLISIAEKYPVLLISATASSASFKNYNMDYLQSKLGGSFVPMSDEEKKAMRDYLKFEEIESNTSFHTCVSPSILSDLEKKNHMEILLSDFDLYARGLLSMTGEILDTGQIRPLREQLQALYDKCLENKNSDSGKPSHDNYQFSVYYDSLWQYINARLSGSHLMIEYRSNKMGYSSGAYSFLDLRDLYRGLEEYYFGKGSSIHHYLLSVRSCLDETGKDIAKYNDPNPEQGIDVRPDLKEPDLTEDEKQKNLDSYIRMISDRYQEDGIGFIIHTTYASASVGVNFYAGIHSNDHNLFSYALYASDNDRQDFDGIILHQPTFLISQTREGEEYYASYQIDRADRIYDLEEMSERGLLDQRSKERFLENGKSTITHEIPGYYETRRVFDQTIGRVMRNSKKSRFMCCQIDQNVAEALANTGSDILTPPITKSVVEASEDYLKKHSIEKSDQGPVFLNKLNNYNKRLRKRIQHLLYRDPVTGRMVNKVRYNEERKISFKYGLDITQETYDSLPKNARSQYIKKPGAGKYYYRQRNDYSEITDYSEIKKPGYIECSYETSYMDLMLQIPCLKEALEKDGIRTGPVADSVYQILPIGHNNFHKGYGGEYSTRVLTRYYLQIELEDITDDAAFEMADFVYGDCLIDAKQYSFYFDQQVDVNEMLNKAASRAVRLQKSRFVYVMPIMRTGNTISQRHIVTDHESGQKISVYIIAGLFYADDHGRPVQNHKSFEVFQNALLGEGIYEIQ